MKLKSRRSRVGNGSWQCSSADRIDNVRARSKVGNVPALDVFPLLLAQTNFGETVFTPTALSSNVSVSERC